jgi:hypothetical protein
VRGHQATGHELLALTEQMRGFVDFAIHGISHR